MDIKEVCFNIDIDEDDPVAYAVREDLLVYLSPFKDYAVRVCDKLYPLFFERAPRNVLYLYGRLQRCVDSSGTRAYDVFFSISQSEAGTVGGLVLGASFHPHSHWFRLYTLMDPSAAGVESPVHVYAVLPYCRICEKSVCSSEEYAAHLKDEHPEYYAATRMVAIPSA